MRVYARDKKIKYKELMTVLKRETFDGALILDSKTVKCLHCHKEYKRTSESCPYCGATHHKHMTKRKTSYLQQAIIQVFRQEENCIIELLFSVYDWMESGALHRDIDLIRKSKYSDKIEIVVRSGVGTYGFNRCLGYYSATFNQGKYYKVKYTEGMAWHTHWSNAPLIGSFNRQLLLKNEILKRVYGQLNIKLSRLTNEAIGKTFKYPYLIEMLYKRSKRLDKYRALPSIKKYKKTFLMYFNYYEKYGYINAKLLQRLSKIPEMISYDVFKKLSHLSYLPKELKSRSDLEKYSRIISKNGYFDQASYKDYLRMAARRGLDTNTEEVKFNRNWKYDHDQWAKEIEIEKEMVKESDFSALMSKYHSKKFKVQKKEIIIEVPHSIRDLFEESDKLHHCVKTYSDQVINGKCIILFVRTKPGEPFITVEVKDGKIVQMRGNRNATNMILPEHKKAVNQFIKQQIKPMEVAAS